MIMILIKIMCVNMHSIWDKALAVLRLLFMGMAESEVCGRVVRVGLGDITAANGECG